MSSRQPRWPSIGLDSVSAMTRSRSSAGSTFIAAATSAISSSLFGRNSCSGGSSRRIVTGRPRMMVKSSTKSLALHAAGAWPAPRGGPSELSARIISRTARMRSPSKNMCSVRQRPMPSAPNSRAARASFGVSALARTCMRRTASAQPISVPKSPVSSGCSVGTRPSKTSPVRAVDGDDVAGPPGLAGDRHGAELRRRSSPRRRRRRRACPCRARRPPRGWSCRRARSGCRAPRPCRGCPPGSSRCGRGARRGRRRFSRSASSAVNTISPVAAPGEAGRPRAIERALGASGSSVGCRSWSSESGSMRPIASSRVISPSAAMSTAIFSAALAVRLPERVCSIHSLPRSMVNSTSCMSR